MRENTMNYKDIITIEPDKRGGKPCIRGLRITVYDVLEYFASGMTPEEILEDFDYLTMEDIQACLSYAAGCERLQITRRDSDIIKHESTMVIYLDNCCFNRPYDDQSHSTIFLETQAKLGIQENILRNENKIT
jgi:uncharacterized protein (DUF433 family)